jgi:hypothetical protein
VTSGPQVAIPTASPPPGVCTEAGLTNAQLIHRWLDLAGKHDLAGLRDCFAPSYRFPDTMADRWANLGAATKTEIIHGPPGLINGCDRFGVTADFPSGNPYAPFQDAIRMFLFVSVAADGDRPRIFNVAPSMVAQSPDVTPHAGPPDCR